MWACTLLTLLIATMCAGCGGADSRASSPGSFGANHATAVDGAAFGGLGEEVDSEESFSDDSSKKLQYAARGDAGGEGSPDAPPPPPAKPKPAPTKHDGTTGKAEPEPSGPLLIYTAKYTMAVYEVTQSIDNVQALAKKAGGYLVRRNDRAITIRVPAKKYRSALSDISKLGDVLHHEESVEDVTEKFFDMKTRLDNARAMRIRLQELLAAAKDVKEALAVERELSRVTEVIERMEGKLRRLRELINFSTITVTFSSRGGENVNSKVNLPFTWLRQLGLGPLLRL